jgi:iron complex outermembrane receptor protein
MKKIAVVYIFLSTVLCVGAMAQPSISGRVIDAETSEALIGVNVYQPDKKLLANTNDRGFFEIEQPAAGAIVRFSHVGYKTKEITYAGGQNIEIEMILAENLEEIIIQSIRAGTYAPVSQSTLKRAKIDEVHIGQDALFMLESLTPSIIAYSESGTNFSNYGQFRLRGIDQSRVNITLNGVPLNDMIDQGVFFSNFTDFSNSMESVQVQRGVGTSTNGTASFAGSINFESINLKDEKPSGEIELVAGSFGTYRGSVAAKTGLMENQTAFYTRFSSFTSDGYRYNAGTDSYSFFGSGAYYAEKDLLKFTTFIGRTKNGLAYTPVAISDIKLDPRTNYLNENDIDDFGQWFFQLQHTHIFSANTSLVSSVYYGGSGGDYPFGYMDEAGNLQQINYPLKNEHLGMMSSMNSESIDGHLNTSFGVHAYTFGRKNMESVVPDDKNPYYEEHSRKNELGFFAKAEYQLAKTRLFADVQLRSLNLNIDPDNTLLPNEDNIIKQWTFINTRIGINYELSMQSQLYASFGRTGREPTKIDLFGGFNLNASNVESVKGDAVNPEFVNDIELGMNFQYPTLQGQANFFYMFFENEIAPIGTYVPEGFLQLRKNMPSSFRRGFELDATWELLPILSLSGNFTYMDSEIREYDPDDDPAVYLKVRPALSPEVQTKGTLSYLPVPWLNVSLSGRYVSESFQEPTNDTRFMMPSFFVSDLGVSLQFGTDHTFDVLFNNIFDTRYFSYGAPIDLDANGSFDEPAYIVQPPRNLFTRLVLKF